MENKPSIDPKNIFSWSASFHEWLWIQNFFQSKSHSVFSPWEICVIVWLAMGGAQLGKNRWYQRQSVFSNQNLWIKSVLSVGLFMLPQHYEINLIKLHPHSIDEANYLWNIKLLNNI